MSPFWQGFSGLFIIAAVFGIWAFGPLRQRHPTLANLSSPSESCQPTEGLHAIADRTAPTAAPHNSDWRIMLAGVMGLLIVPAGLYLSLGSPESVAFLASPHGAAAQPAGAAGQSQTDAPDLERLASLADLLARRLQKEPQDWEGWMLMARTATALGRHAEAVRAYGVLAERFADDADVHADLADAMVSAANGQFAPASIAQIQRALSLDSQNRKALELSATAAWRGGDRAGAVRQWSQVQTLLQTEWQALADDSRLAENERRERQQQRSAIKADLERLNTFLASVQRDTAGGR